MKMKTLILNGATRQNGDTAALQDAFTSQLDGECRVVSVLDHIAPCSDCRACWSLPGCRIRDEMQWVYSYLEQCDNVVLASPIWFSSLSGPLLTIASRLQPLFAARRFRGEKPRGKAKNGVILLVGAQKGTEVAPVRSAEVILQQVQVRLPCVATVCSLHTDTLPAREDAEALQEARRAARLLNELCKQP